MSVSKEIQAITPSGTPRPLMPYSPAVKAGDWLFVAGQMATDFVNGLAPDIAATTSASRDKLSAETKFIFDTLVDTVTPAGADLARDTVRQWNWYTDPLPSQKDFDEGRPWNRINVGSVHEVAAQTFTGVRPAESNLGIRELLVRETTLEIDLICRLDGGQNEAIAAPDGLEGVVSSDHPAVRRGDYVFTSSQHGADSASPHIADLVHGGPTEFERQADRALEKLAAIAESAGSSLKRAFKAEVYLGRPGDLSQLERVWRRWFPDNPPARLVVPYMATPVAGSLVEIALSLLRDDSPLTVEAVQTSAAPEPVGWEPQAVRVDDLLYFSTQMAVDSKGSLAEGMQRKHAFPYYGEPARNQMRYVLDNVAAIAEAGGTELENIVRRACFHQDYEDFQQSMHEFAVRFPDLKPASTTLGLTRGPLAVPGAAFLLDLIAYAPR
jgi:enamine deaminase RidA (YjgF/YER057c/UK114 family)